MSSPKVTVQQALAAARETRSLEVGRNNLRNTAAAFRAQFASRPAAIVADRITFDVAGREVLESFRQANHACLEPFVYTDPKLYAEHSYLLQLEQWLKQHDAIPVAVGAGTINDLVKLAAHRANRPYMCVATAASMDGYTAFGASVTFEGSKQSFDCPAPTAVVADLAVICGAPQGMTASGYADLLAKITAGADWILADALGIEPIHAQSWAIIQDALRDALDNPLQVCEREPRAMERLIEGLMLAGFAMQAARTSRPAAGAEHQFSHLWDMQHHTHQGAAPSHGFKVGIGTLATAALYERLLNEPLEKLDIDRCCATWPAQKSLEETIRNRLGHELAGKSIEETLAKYSEPAELRQQLERIRNLWPSLKERLREQLFPFEKLKVMLRDAGAPHEPEQIGISRARLRESFWQAYFIRRRFTVLDLAVRTNMLERSLDSLFGRNGLWPVSTSGT